MKRTVAFLTLSVAFACHGYSQQKEHFFFHPYAYGSDALFNPVSLLATGGFDAFQFIADRSGRWSEVYWDKSTTNVWRSVTSSFPIINKFGWSAFLRQEVLPLSFNMDDAQYPPNYALHLIGGGMTFRKISEWYDYNGFPAPYIFGAATRVAYEYINEAVENGPNTFPNEDCLPDMLIFQPAGMLLFSFDDVSEFFSSTLSLNDWSYPAALTFSPFAVRNAGQNYVMKLALNRERSMSLFVHFGDFAILGLSLKTSNEEAISFGAGVVTTGVIDLPERNGVRTNTIATGAMAGIYFDRNNSLLASAVYSQNIKSVFRLNIYPGVLSSSAVSPGFFITLDHRGSMIAGLTAQILPVGLGMKTTW